MRSIHKDTVKFLDDLKKNNDRDWFQKNKSRYETAHKNVIEFSEALLTELSKTDNIETASGKKALYRIYRDIRFSKDKSPYKTWFAGGFKRATAQLRGGYYFHIEPNAVFAAGGFWGPNKEDLLLIRQQIQADPEPLQEIVNNKDFKKQFGTLIGDQLKTAPKGFEKDDPAIELLRYKQFLVKKDIDPKQITSSNLVKEITETFVAMRSFFDYMSEILTTDLNGEPLH